MSETKKEKVNVLFVCTGNTCRSPMAEQLFSDWLKKEKAASVADVSSAGIYAENGKPMTPEAAGVLFEMGISVRPHKSRLLTIDVIQNADVIVCMTEDHREALLHSFSYLAAASDGRYRIVGTVRELTGEDVCDPFGRGVDAYRAAANAISAMCAPLLTEVYRYRDEYK